MIFHLRHLIAIRAGERECLAPGARRGPGRFRVAGAVGCRLGGPAVQPPGGPLRSPSAAPPWGPRPPPPWLLRYQCLGTGGGSLHPPHLHPRPARPEMPREGPREGTGQAESLALPLRLQRAAPQSCRFTAGLRPQCSGQRDVTRRRAEFPAGLGVGVGLRWGGVVRSGAFLPKASSQLGPSCSSPTPPLLPGLELGLGRVTLPKPSPPAGRQAGRRGSPAPRARLS